MAGVARGGWESWEWDETLFAGAAPYYVQGRVPYAPGVGDTLVATLPLDGQGRLLDLGCGPGVVALSLAHLFDAVVGLDPDAGMLAEATRIADERSIRNATWAQLRAEDLPAGLGSFRVVTLAASFHWMDRPRVAAILRSMLEIGGAAVQVDAPAYRPADVSGRGELQVALQYPRPPTDVEELVRRYLGPDRRAGRGIRKIRRTARTRCSRGRASARRRRRSYRTAASWSGRSRTSSRRCSRRRRARRISSENGSQRLSGSFANCLPGLRALAASP